MTHKEAIKNLTELQIRLINDNSEEAIEYNKKIYDTLAYFITHTIPLSVIEKIHDAIDNADFDARLEDESGSFTEEVFTREHITEIIDKAVKEVNSDCTTCVHSDETDGSNSKIPPYTPYVDCGFGGE